MTAKLLEFNIKDFVVSQKASYNEKLHLFKKEKRIKWLLISAELILTLLITFQFLYYICIRNSVASSLGIILIGLSVGTLLKNATLNKLCFSFSEQPKQEYELEFMQAILEQKILSAEIVYNSIFLQYNLSFTYINYEKKCSDIKITLQKKSEIDELWYDLRTNTLYVPNEKFNLVRYKLKIPVDLSNILV